MCTEMAKDVKPNKNWRKKQQRKKSQIKACKHMHRGKLVSANSHEKE